MFCFLFTADTAQTWSYGPHSTSAEGGKDFTDALCQLQVDSASLIEFGSKFIEILVLYYFSLA